MRFFLFLAASVCIALAWLLPIHYRPWVTYTGELFAFLSLFALSALFLKEKLLLPKVSLPLLLLSLVPFIQYGFGELFFFSKALMCGLYIFAFWLSMVLGFNLSQKPLEREQLFSGLCTVFWSVGLVTALIATCQWLNIEQYIPGMTALKGDRPYANFAQPNNMASFLILSLLGTLYLFEKKKFNSILLCVSAALMLFAVALSQSRTSWVASICVLLYLLYQQYKGVVQLKWYSALAWFALFIAFTAFIPQLNHLLAQLSNVEVTQTRDAVARATGDMSRLAIWQQMLHAIAERPWFGYGWHQTSVAYTLISDQFQGPVWVKSAHNFILDFILWNGLVIAIPFFAYLSYWGYQLQKHATSLESVIGLLMVGALLIHGMLEFPLFYAYFLLPLGLILGIIQSQQKVKTWTLPSFAMPITFTVCVVLVALIIRDYELMVPKLNQASRYEHTPEKFTNQDHILLLSEFNRRIEWIQLNPYSKVSPEQIRDYEEMVLNYPIPYDLTKFAKLLAFNGYEAEARHQLWRLKTLRKIELRYEDLLQPASSVQ